VLWFFLQTLILIFSVLVQRLYGYPAILTRVGLVCPIIFIIYGIMW